VEQGLGTLNLEEFISSFLSLDQLPHTVVYPYSIDLSQ